VKHPEIQEAASILGDRAEQNVTLGSLTTFRIGGPADLVVRPRTVLELVSIAESLAGLSLAYLVLGQGSNVLISDSGFRGLVILVDGEFGDWSETDCVVTAGSAVKMPVLARQCAQRGVGGLAWMVGVPGSVGGAVRMNAGGHGADIATNLLSAKTVDLTSGVVREHTNEELQFGYRSSAITASDMVVSASFQCQPGNVEELEEEISAIVRWRREHQPGGANCGSVFTNPPGDSAGRLIDAAGLKGYRLGGAEVSPKHANFIQANEHASSKDVWELIIEVRRRVFDQFGVDLHPEVRTIGFDGTLPILSDETPAVTPAQQSATTPHKETR
jgi:UDP-N-acetylmuramate dehydrogenase